MPGMMTLIALAILTAYTYSVAVVVIGEGETLFWELATLITVMLLGHWIEMRSVQGAQGALRELSKLLPDKAEVIRDGEVVEIPITELKEGDIIKVRPGAKVPADAKVIKGSSDVDEAIITGESKPVDKKVGDEIIAGTINGNGSLDAEVIHIGEKTFLAGVMRLVAEAQASKSKLQLLSDKAAFWLTIVAIGVGAVTFTGWFLADAGFGFSITRTVAVLVIACPHALGLAIPLVAAISTTMAARNGFLVRERIALEKARDVDIVFFDKTGTLTRGEFGVDKIWTTGAESERGVLLYAASVDSQSEHYVSRAIVRKAKEDGIDVAEVKDFQRIPGKGVKGIVNGVEISSGGAAFMKDYKEAIPDTIKEEVNEEGDKGKTIIFIFKEEKLIGILSLGDIIREESKEAVKDLKDLGIKVGMVTGDSEKVALWVAKELEIDQYHAEILPGEKSEKIRELQNKGMKVAMVGDGINDAPALTQADLGIAIGAGTNVAIESAGIILVKNSPGDIVKIIRLSKHTHTKMIQNLFWATGYNVVAIPLAAGVLYSQGIVLQPALAALLMSISTVIVAFNAVLLRRKKL
jgi:Cu2+-exporting ATPase